MKRLYYARLNSFRGFAYGFASEPALREEAILFVAGVVLGYFLAPSAAWYVAMVGTLLVLLAVEFLNTAIEKLADYITLERRVEIRRIKDFGSAAVFCLLCLTGVVWIVALALRFGLL